MCWGNRGEQQWIIKVLQKGRFGSFHLSLQVWTQISLSWFHIFPRNWIQNYYPSLPKRWWILNKQSLGRSSRHQVFIFLVTILTALAFLAYPSVYGTHHTCCKDWAHSIPLWSKQQDNVFLSCRTVGAKSSHGNPLTWCGRLAPPVLTSFLPTAGLVNHRQAAVPAAALPTRPWSRRQTHQDTYVHTHDLARKAFFEVTSSQFQLSLQHVQCHTVKSSSEVTRQNVLTVFPSDD